MQLDMGLGATGQRASEGVKGDLHPAVQRLLVHLIEGVVHKPREPAFDHHTLANQKAHQIADRAVLAQRNE